MITPVFDALETSAKSIRKRLKELEIKEERLYSPQHCKDQLEY